MKVIKSLYTTINTEEKEYRYSYRMFLDNFKNGHAYGVEIERQDFVGEELVKIERDNISKISCNEEKVASLLNLLFENVVSPIHLVDIIGEFVDQYVEDFDVTESIAVSL